MTTNTTINTTILSLEQDEVDKMENYIEHSTVVRHQGYNGVVVEFLGKTFAISEIEKLLSHMKYLDNLEDDE